MIRKIVVLAFVLSVLVNLSGESSKAARANDLSGGGALALASPHGAISDSEEFLLTHQLPTFECLETEACLERKGDLIVKPAKRTVVRNDYCRIVIPAGAAALIRRNEKRLIVRNLSANQCKSLLVYFEKTPCKVRSGQEAEVASDLLTLRQSGD